jgi:succinate dehydrogenase hydrophobic anchor subunit
LRKRGVTPLLNYLPFLYCERVVEHERVNCMDLNTDNIVLLCFLVFLVLVFIWSIVVAISPRILFNLLLGWPTKLALKIRRVSPSFFTPGEELWKDIDKKIGESRRQSLAFWLTRICAIIFAISVFMIIWILGPFQMLWLIIKYLIL